MLHSLQATTSNTWMEYLVRLLVSHLVLLDAPVDVANINSLQLELLATGLLLTNLARFTLIAWSRATWAELTRDRAVEKHASRGRLLGSPYLR